MFGLLQIAATYGNTIKIFEPISNAHEKKKPVLNCRWIETQCFTVKERVKSVLWNMDGLRMTVVVGDELFLYQHRSLSSVVPFGSTAPVTFCVSEEDHAHDANIWHIIWSVQLGQHPRYIKFSPDGTFLAISGEHDKSVKIIYQDLFVHSTCSVCIVLSFFYFMFFKNREKNISALVSSFLIIQHPFEDSSGGGLEDICRENVCKRS
ncbi:unnamed protein product [Haemonchus placei]|uniref:ANAPC4_WD40 domain-containing protein n=1 Tax=Haemonchus placei TaxID=6290 RepID=A0A0N4X6H9_HAEPC|nr:unnamed protein product [Haemonchus placei]